MKSRRSTLIFYSVFFLILVVFGTLLAMSASRLEPVILAIWAGTGTMIAALIALWAARLGATRPR